MFIRSIGRLGRTRALAFAAICAAFMLLAPAATGAPRLKTASAADSAADSVSMAASGLTPAHWTWPLNPPHRIAAAFQAPSTRYSAGHRGIDIVATGSQPVYAPDAALVRFSGTVVDRPVITLDLGSGVLVSMEPVAASVAVGAHVSAGATVGARAAGGHCDSTCLHFGVRVNGAYVSPLLFLGGVERAILLPLP